MIIEEMNPNIFLNQIKKILEQEYEQIFSKFMDNSHLRQSNNIEEELQQCLIHNAMKQNLLQRLYYASRQLIKKVEERYQHYQKQINSLNEDLVKSNYIYKNQNDNLKELIKQQQNKLKMIEGEIIQVNEQNDKSKQRKMQKQHEFELILQEKQNLRQSYNILQDQNKKFKMEIQKLTLLYDHLQQKIEIQKNLNQQLTSKHQAALKEIKSLQQNVFILQIDIRNYKDLVDQLRAENSRTSSKISLISQSKAKQLLQYQYDQNKPMNFSRRYQQNDILEQTSESKFISSKLQKTSNKKMLNELIKIDSENSTKARKIQKQDYAYFDRRSKFNGQISEFSDSSSDPYHCFFLLLVQCAKLNSKKFTKLASININDYWQTLVNSCVPMNKWYDRIVIQLQKRIH